MGSAGAGADLAFCLQPYWESGSSATAPTSTAPNLQSSKSACKMAIVAADLLLLCLTHVLSCCLTHLGVPCPWLHLYLPAGHKKGKLSTWPAGELQLGAAAFMSCLGTWDMSCLASAFEPPLRQVTPLRGRVVLLSDVKSFTELPQPETVSSVCTRGSLWPWPLNTNPAWCTSKTTEHATWQTKLKAVQAIRLASKIVRRCR